MDWYAVAFMWTIPVGLAIGLVHDLYKKDKADAARWAKRYPGEPDL